LRERGSPQTGSSTIQSIGFGTTGESFEIRACARDLRLGMDPENVPGDRDALEELVRHHQRWIYNIAVRMPSSV